MVNISKRKGRLSLPDLPSESWQDIWLWPVCRRREEDQTFMDASTDVNTRLPRMAPGRSWYYPMLRYLPVGPRVGGVTLLSAGCA